MIQKMVLGSAGSLRRIYGFSVVSTLGALLGVLVGMGSSAAFTVLVLIALEITFSLDNAVVNAKILARMPALWSELFMTVGIVVAVFGVRLILPVVLVAVSAGLDMGTVVDLALRHPQEYGEALHHTRPIISSFGGMFLLLIFLRFILDTKRDIHWLRIIERPLAKIGQLDQLPVIIALTVLLIAAQLLAPQDQGRFIILFAGVLGILTEMIIAALVGLFERQHQEAVARSVHHAGLLNFLYLEVMDASFSLDGVIGAFALTNMIGLIALGLGIGAIWVRSMTVHMVRHRTLAKYRYLDHGAHYAIGVLAVMLLVSLGYELPEAVTGTIGISIIGWALLDSWRHNRREARGVVNA